MEVTFEESLRRLTPIIGKDKANKLWRSYLLEDRDGQNDIYAWVKLKLEKEIGQESTGSGNFLSLPSTENAIGKYYIGDVVQSGEDSVRFGLRDNEMIQHLTIFGRSGSGKTNTVIRLIRELVKNKKPFLLFDWKQNYRDLIACKNPVPLDIYTVGKNARPLHFNPLIPPKGTPPKVWLKKLIEIACNSFYLGEGVSFILQDGIDAVYQEFGVYEYKLNHKYPTMQDVLRHIQELTVKGRKSLWVDSSLRALQTLCFGPISEVINVSSNQSLDQLLKQNAILELDALANAEKVFIIESLMIWIHHYRLVERKREVFKHAIIIEEAHNILNFTEKDNVINTLLREIREFGESIVLVDQHPSQMSIPAMGNTFTTIALNVKHNKDVQSLGDAMQVSYKDNALFGQLPVGKAIVKLQARFNQPFLIEIPKESLPKGTVTDLDLMQLYKRDSSNSVQTETIQQTTEINKLIPESRKEDNRPINELEELFIKDVLKNPFDGVVRRYSRLNLSRRRGNVIREKLIAKGVLNAVDVFLKKGKIVLLEPTYKMKQSLEKKGIFKINHRAGGLPHQYWKSKLKYEFKRNGFKVEEEKPIGNGESVDLFAKKDNLKIGIEIEASSRGLININKLLNAGYDYIFSFAINGYIRSNIEKGILRENISADKIILATPVDYEERVRGLTFKN